ncbi:hypothetical protein BJ742DRAFT_772803 [Cladochytrium replicatum]|nr:hypothetical protein BJ742DRAFT_772803 [Cladochytrium replicatum]
MSKPLEMGFLSKVAAIKDAIKAWEEKTKENSAEAKVVKLTVSQPFIWKMDSSLAQQLAAAECEPPPYRPIPIYPRHFYTIRDPQRTQPITIGIRASDAISAASECIDMSSSHDGFENAKSLLVGCEGWDGLWREKRGVPGDGYAGGRGCLCGVARSGLDLRLIKSHARIAVPFGISYSRKVAHQTHRKVAQMIGIPRIWFAPKRKVDVYVVTAIRFFRNHRSTWIRVSNLRTTTYENTLMESLWQG